MQIAFCNYLIKAHLRSQPAPKHYTLSNGLSREIKKKKKKGFRIIGAIVLQRKMNGNYSHAMTGGENGLEKWLWNPGRFLWSR